MRACAESEQMKGVWNVHKKVASESADFQFAFN